MSYDPAKELRAPIEGGDARDIFITEENRNGYGNS